MSNDSTISAPVRWVAVQLIQACGGVDVPDEQVIPIQASALRSLANQLVPGISNEP